MTPPMLVIDTETGGLDPAIQSILSLACVPFPIPHHGVPNTFHQFINEPKIVAKESALQINKLDVEWVKANGLTPQVTVDALEVYLSGQFGTITKENRIVLIGQNVEFDVGFLKRLFRLAGREKRYAELFSYRTMDTAGLARFLILAGRLPLTDASGSTLGEYFSCPPTTAHDALADALSTAGVLSGLIRIVQPWWKRNLF